MRCNYLGKKLWFQAIKMVYLKTKLPPITCRGDQKWTKIWPQKPKIGSNWTLLGALKATPKRRRFERVLTLIPKVGPKLTKNGQKEVKNDQNDQKQKANLIISFLSQHPHIHRLLWYTYIPYSIVHTKLVLHSCW